MNWLAAGLMACLVFGQDPNPRKPPVTVRVDTLFDSSAGAEWHTFILEVTNQTASDQEFTISVDLGQADRAVRREKFAAKVRKRLFLYLPAESHTSRAYIRVHDGSGREVLSQEQDMAFSPYRSTGTPKTMAALMARPPGQIPNGSTVKVIPAELFPDRAIGLEGITHAIIRDYPLDSLLPAQRAALLEWLQRGGLVVLYAGSNRDWLTTPAVQELAPVTLGPSETLETIPELEKAFGRFREKISFARHTFGNGDPFGEYSGGAVKFRNGRGTVIVLPYDLERAPFDSWPGTAQLRDWLTGYSVYRDHNGDLIRQPRNPSEVDDMPRLARDLALIHRAATVDVNQLPPFLLLLTLTSLYLIAVGPVNFFVLKRLRMTVRLVFTIPAISAIFLGIVVASGYVLRGTSTVTFDVAVLEAQAGSGLAFEQHYLSIFAPAPRTYSITFGAGETGTPRQIASSYEDLEYQRWRGRRYGGHDMESNAVYDQTDRWKVRDVPFDQWQTRAFVGDAVRSIDGGVTFKYGAELEVTNRTPYTIRRGWAIEKLAAFQACPFGEVPPGETRTFPLVPAPEAHRQHDWIEAPNLEDRIIAGWLFTAARGGGYRPYLLCVLDRLPDEITVDAHRSSQSQRLCLLQVGGAR